MMPSHTTPPALRLEPCLLFFPVCQRPKRDIEIGLFENFFSAGPCPFLEVGIQLARHRPQFVADIAALVAPVADKVLGFYVVVGGVSDDGWRR